MFAAATIQSADFVKGMGRRLPPPALGPELRRLRGFTLIELMIVLAIMGIMMAIGVPIVYKINHREALNQAVRDVVEVLSNARARAILQGKMTELAIHPRERRLTVAGASATPPDKEGDPFAEKPETPPPAESGLSATIPESITIEMLDVNLIEYKDREYGRVRFYPNGTCDEFTLIMRSEKGEFIKIWLEITTSLANVGKVDER